MISETDTRSSLEEVYCRMCGQKFFRERGDSEQYCKEHRLDEQ